MVVQNAQMIYVYVYIFFFAWFSFSQTVDDGGLMFHCGFNGGLMGGLTSASIKKKKKKHSFRTFFYDLFAVLCGGGLTVWPNAL